MIKIGLKVQSVITASLSMPMQLLNYLNVHSTPVPNHFTFKCGPVATGATSVVEVDLFDSCLSNIAGAEIHSGTRQVQCW